MVNTANAKTKPQMKLGAYWIPVELLERFSKHAKEIKTPMSRIVTQLLSDYLARDKSA